MNPYSILMSYIDFFQTLYFEIVINSRKLQVWNRETLYISPHFLKWLRFIKLWYVKTGKLTLAQSMCVNVLRYFTAHVHLL